MLDDKVITSPTNRWREVMFFLFVYWKNNLENSEKILMKISGVVLGGIIKKLIIFWW